MARLRHQQRRQNENHGAEPDGGANGWPATRLAIRELLEGQPSLTFALGLAPDLDEPNGIQNDDLACESCSTQTFWSLPFVLHTEPQRR